MLITCSPLLMRGLINAEHRRTRQYYNDQNQLAMQAPINQFETTAGICRNQYNQYYEDALAQQQAAPTRRQNRPHSNTQQLIEGESIRL